MVLLWALKVAQSFELILIWETVWSFGNRLKIGGLYTLWHEHSKHVKRSVGIPSIQLPRLNGGTLKRAGIVAPWQECVHHSVENENCDYHDCDGRYQGHPNLIDTAEWWIIWKLCLLRQLTCHWNGCKTAPTFAFGSATGIKNEASPYIQGNEKSITAKRSGLFVMSCASMSPLFAIRKSSSIRICSSYDLNSLPHPGDNQQDRDVHRL